MIKTRYKFLKRLYKDYILVFIVKGYYYVYYRDVFVLSFKEKTLIQTLESNHINYIIIDNLTIIKKTLFKDNRYYEFLFKNELVTSLCYNFNEAKKNEDCKHDNKN